MLCEFPKCGRVAIGTLWGGVDIATFDHPGGRRVCLRHMKFVAAMLAFVSVPYAVQAHDNYVPEPVA